MNIPREPDVLVVGAGVIGVCSAYYLAQQGLRVLVLDQGGVAAGSSYGNAGLVVPSHVVPLAHPGALSRGLKWLLDPEAPFYVKPRLDPDLLRWLWSFWRASAPTRLAPGIQALHALGYASRALYDALAEEGSQEWSFESRGLLQLCRTPQAFEEVRSEARVLEEAGGHAQVLDAAGLKALEPGLRPEVIGGVHYLDDAHLDPARFVRAIAARAEARGVDICPGVEVLGFAVEKRAIVAVQTTHGDMRPAQVVLAAGAWAPRLGRELGLRLPVQAAKGYSLTYHRPAEAPRHPMLLQEARVAVTPMGGWLRLAGTLELAGLDLSINRRRVAAIVRSLGAYHTLRAEVLELAELWRGLRPATPDGLPIIGRAPACENLILATGHAMLGMSLGPITGALVAQIAAGQTPDLDLTPYRPERFALR